MRITSSVTSISWIPSEAVEGMLKLGFELGVAHYDDPPPELLSNLDEDLEELRHSDRYRFANHLKAWIEVEGGRIVDHGYAGGGWIGATTMRLGPKRMTITAVQLPDRQHAPVVTDGSVTFVQTSGGRTGVPMPRRVSAPPFLQISAPLAWTTLQLRLNSDGSSARDVVGASPFPRHWIYDETGALVQKTGLISFKNWAAKAFGKHTPWGDQDSPTLVTEVESALERQLSAQMMGAGAKPDVRRVSAGSPLVREGDPGTEIYLVLDGVISVEVGQRLIAHVGPGAVLGERALLETGRRTASLSAVTDCKVAAMDGAQLSAEALRGLAHRHRREDLMHAAD